MISIEYPPPHRATSSGRAVRAKSRVAPQAQPPVGARRLNHMQNFRARHRPPRGAPRSTHFTRNGGPAPALARAFALHALTSSQRVGSRAHPPRLPDFVRCHVRVAIQHSSAPVGKIRRPTIALQRRSHPTPLPRIPPRPFQNCPFPRQTIPAASPPSRATASDLRARLNDTRVRVLGSPIRTTPYRLGRPPWYTLQPGSAGTIHETMGISRNT